MKRARAKNSTRRTGMRARPERWAMGLEGEKNEREKKRRREWIGRRDQYRLLRLSWGEREKREVKERKERKETGERERMREKDNQDKWRAKAAASVLCSSPR